MCVYVGQGGRENSLTTSFKLMFRADGGLTSICTPTPAVLLLQPAATLSTPQRRTTKHVPVFGRMFFPRWDPGGLTSLLYPSIMQSHRETHAVFTDTQL